MELTFNVDNSLARKIQGLSVLTGKTAGEITGDLSSVIENEVNRGILQALNLTPKDVMNSIGSDLNNLNEENSFEKNKVSGFYSEELPTMPSKKELYDNFNIDEDPIEDEEELNMAESLGVEESRFDEFDVSLPAEEISTEPLEDKTELVLPSEDENEEEVMMPIKDKNGDDVGHDDSIMSELQRELENGGLDGVSEDAYEDDDEREFNEDAPRRAIVTGSIPSDAPTAEGYEKTSPDVLPVDFGINQVSTEDGSNSSGAMSFFNNAFVGKQGDKSARNSVKRRRIITDF